MKDNNFFQHSEHYIKEICNNLCIPPTKRKNFPGKSMAFLFLTKFCDVECAHCFFKSRKNINNEQSIEYEFSEDGLNKVINFINKSNNGYLSVLGGGEPFNRFDYIQKIMHEVKTDRLVLVTSGNWGKDYKEAEEKISIINNILQSRKDNLKLILRISVDKWHILKIGKNSVLNIINIIKKQTNPNFELELHTLTDDNSLDEIFKTLGNYVITDYKKCVSDNEDVMKLGYARYKVIFDDHFELKIGIAQKFNSNLKVNLKNKPSNLSELLQYFDNDIEKNCFGNPSLVYNKGNIQGLDFLISYNGNVSTWGNDQSYDLNNLYIHSYEEILKRTFENIISYSFIDKGYKYRENIFNEINPIAVLRSKAINIRDYAGISLFEEKASVLYYAIRVIQDYLQEKLLEEKDLDILSNELKKVISLNKQELINLYKKSNYTIVDQYIKDASQTFDDWKDLLELIRLGHYDVSESKIQEGLTFFNTKFEQNINNIEEFKSLDENQYIRLLNRLAKIDKKVFEYNFNK